MSELLDNLYNVAGEEYDLGEKRDFYNSIRDPQARRNFWETIGETYDLGDWEDFNGKVDNELRNEDNWLMRRLKTVGNAIGSAGAGFLHNMAATAERMGGMPTGVDPFGGVHLPVTSRGVRENVEEARDIAERSTSSIEERQAAAERIKEGTASERDKVIGSGQAFVNETEDLQQEYANAARRYTGEDATFTDLLKEKRIGDALELGVITAIESSPQMAMGATPQGRVMLGVLSAADEYDRLAKEHPEMSKTARAAQAVLVGTIEQFFESRFNPFKLGGAGGRGAISKQIRDWGLKGWKAKGKDLLKQLGIWGKEALGEGFEEIATSAYTDIAKTIIDRFDGNGEGWAKAMEEAKEEVEANGGEFSEAQFWGNVGKGLLDDFLGGFFAGAYAGGGTMAAADTYNWAGNRMSTNKQQREELRRQSAVLNSVVSDIAEEEGISRKKVLETLDNEYEARRNGEEGDYSYLDKLDRGIARYYFDRAVDNDWIKDKNGGTAVKVPMYTNGFNGDYVFYFQNPVFNDDGTIDYSQSTPSVGVPQVKEDGTYARDRKGNYIVELLKAEDANPILEAFNEELKRRKFKTPKIRLSAVGVTPTEISSGSRPKTSTKIEPKTFAVTVNGNTYNVTLKGRGVINDDGTIDFEQNKNVYIVDENGKPIFEDKEAVRQAVNEELKKQKESETVENQVRDGVNAEGQPAPTPEPVPAEPVPTPELSSENLTPEQAAADEQMAQMNAEEQRINDMNLRLEQQLQEKGDAVMDRWTPEEQFVYTMTHTGLDAAIEDARGALEDAATLKNRTRRRAVMQQWQSLIDQYTPQDAEPAAEQQMQEQPASEVPAQPEAPSPEPQVQQEPVQAQETPAQEEPQPAPVEPEPAQEEPAVPDMNLLADDVVLIYRDGGNYKLARETEDGKFVTLDGKPLRGKWEKIKKRVVYRFENGQPVPYILRTFASDEELLKSSNGYDRNGNAVLYNPTTGAEVKIPRSELQLMKEDGTFTPLWQNPMERQRFAELKRTAKTLDDLLNYVVYSYTNTKGERIELKLQDILRYSSQVDANNHRVAKDKLIGEMVRKILRDMGRDVENVTGGMPEGEGGNLDVQVSDDYRNVQRDIVTKIKDAIYVWNKMDGVAPEDKLKDNYLDLAKNIKQWAKLVDKLAGKDAVQKTEETEIPKESQRPLTEQEKQEALEQQQEFDETRKQEQLAAQAARQAEQQRLAAQKATEAEGMNEAQKKIADELAAQAEGWSVRELAAAAMQQKLNAQQAAAIANYLGKASVDAAKMEDVMSRLAYQLSENRHPEGGGWADRIQRRLSANRVIKGLRNLGMPVEVISLDDAVAKGYIPENLAKKIKAEKEAGNKDGLRAYGVAANNTAYIIEDLLNPETPIHECTHLWVNWFSKENPEQWAKYVEVLKQTGEWNRISNNKKYQELYKGDEQKIAGEVMSMLVGDYMSQKGMFGNTRAEELLSNSLIVKVRAIVRKFLQQLAQMFGINTNTGVNIDTELRAMLEQPLNDMISLGGEAGAIIAGANAKQTKTYDLMLSGRTRGTIDSWFAKRTDLTPEEKDEVINYLENLESNKLQLATARWYANGAIRIPEDMSKVRHAIAVAERAKVDPLQYDNPMALINDFPEIKIKEKPINPNNVPTLHKNKSIGNVTIYDVDDTQESREWMRKIINTHLGKDSSPWCLLQGDKDGNLTSQSAYYWQHYNAYPKQVAFKNGKLVAFSANDYDTRVWWNTQDVAQQGIENGYVEGEDGWMCSSYVNPETGEVVIDENYAYKGNKTNGIYETRDILPHGDIRRTATKYKNGKKHGVSHEYYTPRDSEETDDNIIIYYNDEEIFNKYSYGDLEITTYSDGNKHYKIESELSYFSVAIIEENDNGDVGKIVSIYQNNPYGWHSSIDYYDGRKGIEVTARYNKDGYLTSFQESKMFEPESLDEDDNIKVLRFKPGGPYPSEIESKVPTHIYEVREYSRLIDEGQQFESYKKVQEILKEEGEDVDFPLYQLEGEETFTEEENRIRTEAQENGTFMKAPNGADTNLTEKQWLQTRTQAFKDWFGDWQNGEGSVVLDENGEPKVVYRGSKNANSYIFHSRYDTGAVWFTDNRAVAEHYARRAADHELTQEELDERVQPVFLNIRDAAAYDAQGKTWTDMDAAPVYLVENNDGQNLTFRTREEAEQYSAENGLDPEDIYETNASGDIAEADIKEGKDGVIFENLIDGTEADNSDIPSTIYVTSSNTQAKSATENVGTFDEENPDIRFMIGSPDPSDINEKTRKRMERNKERYLKNNPNVNTTPSERLSGTARVIYENEDNTFGLYLLQKKINLWRKEHGRDDIPDSMDVRSLLIRCSSAIESRFKIFNQRERKTLEDVRDKMVKKLKKQKEFLRRYAVDNLVEEDAKGNKFQYEPTPEDLLERYLIARDNVERAELKEYGWDIDTRGEREFYQRMGVTMDQYVDEFHKIFSDSEIRELWDAIHGCTDLSLRALLEGGRISEELYDRLLEREFYVPEKDFAESNTNQDLAEQREQQARNKRKGGRRNPTASAVQFKAEGGESMAANVFENIVHDVQNSISVGEVNKVRKAMFDLMNDNQDYVEEYGIPRPKQEWYVKVGEQQDGTPIYEATLEKPSEDLIEEAKETNEIIKQMNDIVKELRTEMKSYEKGTPEYEALKQRIKNANDYIAELRKTLPVVTGSTARNVTKLADPRTDVPKVSVYIDGIKYDMTFDGMREVADALNGEYDLRGLMEGVKKFNAAVASAFTTYNPTFFAVNIARDVPYILAKGTSEYGWEFAGRFAKALTADGVATRKPIIDYLAGRLDENTPEGQMFYNFLMGGGNTGYSQIQDIRQIREDFNKTGFSHTWVGQAMEFSAKLNEYSELLTRYAAYKAMIESGYSENEALNAAKNLSTNFNIRGAGNKFINFFNSMSMFSNAAIQGASGFFKTFSTPASAARAFGLMCVGPAFLGFLNTLLCPDDDDKEKKVSDYYRDNYFVFGPIKIPLTQELRPFWRIGVNIAMGMQGRRTAGEIADSIISGFTEYLMPLPPAINEAVTGLVHGIEQDGIGTGIIKGTASGVTNFIIPQYADGVKELISNKDFMGNEIRKDYQWSDTPQYQMNPNEALFFRDMAKGFYWISGGWRNDSPSKYKKDPYSDIGERVGIDVSPKELRLMAGTICSTGLLQFVCQAYGLTVGGARALWNWDADELTSRVRARDWWVYGNFVRPEEQSMYRYAITKEMKQLVKDYDVELRSFNEDIRLAEGAEKNELIAKRDAWVAAQEKRGFYINDVKRMIDDYNKTNAYSIAKKQGLDMENVEKEHPDWEDVQKRSVQAMNEVLIQYNGLERQLTYLEKVFGHKLPDRQRGYYEKK